MAATPVSHRSAVGIAALSIMLLTGSMTGANADPITYSVSGDLIFPNQYVGTLDYAMSGSFTYDPSGTASALDVTLTSVTPAINSVLTWDGSAAYDATTMIFHDTQFGNADVLYLQLGTDLTALPASETITGATIACGYDCSNTTTSSSAEATSTPEPASLALLGAGLTFLPVAARSRFRQAAP